MGAKTAASPAETSVSTSASVRPIIESRQLCKRFGTGNDAFFANDDVNIAVYPNQTVCIVGESGCGKSTFARMAVGLESVTSGELLLDGEDIASLKGADLRAMRKKVQMVFQDPMGSFAPRMRIREAVCQPLYNYGLIKRSQMRDKAIELLESVGLSGQLVDRFPHELSGGQRQRVSVARALSISPELLICDEATSALDVSAQREVVDLLVKLQREGNLSILFICHDMALVSELADFVVVMYLGRVVEQLPADDLRRDAKHPYTQLLIDSVFDLSGECNAPEAPDAASDAVSREGCLFANRCPHCTEKCTSQRPKPVKVEPGHIVACHLYGDES